MRVLGGYMTKVFLVDCEQCNNESGGWQMGVCAVIVSREVTIALFW